MSNHQFSKGCNPDLHHCVSCSNGKMELKDFTRPILIGKDRGIDVHRVCNFCARNTMILEKRSTDSLTVLDAYLKEQAENPEDPEEAYLERPKRERPPRRTSRCLICGVESIPSRAHLHNVSLESCQEARKPTHRGPNLGFEEDKTCPHCGINRSSANYTSPEEPCDKCIAITVQLRQQNYKLWLPGDGRPAPKKVHCKSCKKKAPR